MSIFEERIQQLTATLSRVNADIDIGTDHLQLRHPVSFRAGHQLLQDVLGDIDLDDHLPADTALDNLQLDELIVVRAFDGVDMQAALSWSGMHWELADDITITAGVLRVGDAAGDITVTAHGTATIGELTLDVDIELPELVLKGRLHRGDVNAASLLTKHGLGDTELVDLQMLASIPFRYVELAITVADLISVEDVLTMPWTAVRLAYTGRTRQAQADVVAIMVIDPGPSEIVIELAGASSRAGTRLEGSAFFEGDNYSMGALLQALENGHTVTPQLPAVIADAQLRALHIDVDTAAETVGLSCVVDWAHDNAALTVELRSAQGQLTAHGVLAIDTVEFQLAFVAGQERVMLASYAAAGSHPLSLDDALRAAGALAGDQSIGINVDVRDVIMAVDGDRNSVVLADIDAGFDLRRLGTLPVVGDLLPADQTLRLALQPSYASTPWPDAKAAVLDTVLPEGVDRPDSFAEGVALTARVELGGEPIELPAAIDLDLDRAEPGPNKSPATTVSGPGPAPTASTAVDKSLGPIHLSKIGFAQETSDGHQLLALSLSGALSVAGLTLELDGFGITYNLDTREVHPRLSGIGLQIDQGPISIGGAFANVNGDFAGRLTLGFPQFSVAALGAFRMEHGTPSLFAYAVLNYPLGGPAFFYVEGLAAGFGLHRQLHLPPVEGLRSFPLVADAIDDANPSSAEDIAALATPRLGEYFIAVGVKFTSFKLLDSFALLVVSAGDELEIDLLGVSSYEAPPDLPSGVPALAKVDLNLIARLLPDEAVLDVRAQISANSYVYNPLCHLSGGFAFLSWFADSPQHPQAKAGDFVLSVGGYGPHYSPPSHYPAVPRVSLTYQINDDVYIKGSGYFALTPSLLMAGASVHCHVGIGSLSAWADFSIDFEVAWEPYHYEAWLHVEIGAKWKCFHTTASADLHIWGPDFGGFAAVDWSVFGFEVEFGDWSTHRPAAISWPRFRQAFLPEADEDIVAVTLTAGMSRMGTTPSGDEQPVVIASQLVIETSSQIPMPLPQGEGGTEGAALGVAPMARSSFPEATQSVAMTRDGGEVDITRHFVDTPVPKAYPRAMWGTALSPSASEDSLIDAIGGRRLVPLPPTVAKPIIHSRQELADHLVDHTDGHDYSGRPLTTAVDVRRLGRPVVEDLVALGLTGASDLVLTPAVTPTAETLIHFDWGDR